MMNITNFNTGLNGVISPLIRPPALVMRNGGFSVVELASEEMVQILEQYYSEIKASLPKKHYLRTVFEQQDPKIVLGHAREYLDTLRAFNVIADSSKNAKNSKVTKKFNDTELINKFKAAEEKQKNLYKEKYSSQAKNFVPE